MGKIEAVVFDLDGVITDTAHYHYLAWKDLAEDLGIFIDEKFNENLKGISRMDSLELILKEGNRQEDFTSEEKEELAAKKNSHYCELLKQLTPKDILPGVQELLTAIKAEGIPIGLASVSKNAMTVLNALNLVEEFHYCADAAKIANSKPDPEIFLTACEGLDATPSMSIGIEDASAGVQAIKAAGMFAVGVGESLDEADYLLKDTSELVWELIKVSFANRKNRE
ncbi:beta-phosphoglucomutase [Neobacillus notoginsengisoli]|uniref:Beta-phosphoglucomutase n=1 Tax=Neobacillus notoginsengisoli TaxID=1578198 RepID=A0A417YY53_9BACI|nr:beta-phosphoglucomutase [Neobacillus notoginsengisoli]RHW42634.1 beta-phosphoglucomutase [Neobacillus notoginsengisoli]